MRSDLVVRQRSLPGGRGRLVRLLAVLAVFAMFATACGGGSSATEEVADPVTTGTDADADETESEVVEEEPEADPEPEEVTATDQTEQEVIEDEVELTAARGGTLRLGMEAETDGMNPGRNRFAVSALQMANAVYDTLAAYDEDGNWVPFLAESFTPSEDLQTWTMKVRPGVTFHDGTTMDAAAVVRNFEAQAADALVSLAVLPFYNDPPIEIIDDMTVQYNLASPTARFPSGLTGQLGYVASPAWLDAADEDNSLDQAPVGTGPFMLEDRQQDTVTRFVRNENWWGMEFFGDVYLDAVEFYPITDSARRVDQLMSGELDGLTTSDAESSVRVQGDDAFQNVLNDGGEEDFAIMNTVAPPFDDIRVRQALTFATSRDEYVAFTGAGVKPAADQFFSPSQPQYNAEVKQESDMPELAGPLIEAYCSEVPDSCTDGRVDIELQYSGPSQVQDNIADILINGWSPYFNVTTQVIPQDAHINEAVFGQFQVLTWRQMGAVDPGNDMVWLYCDSAGLPRLNWASICDESRDELLYAERASSDNAERNQLWQDIVAKFQDDYAYIFFAHTLWTNSFDQGVKDVCAATAPDGTPLLCSVSGRHKLHQIWMTE